MPNMIKIMCFMYSLTKWLKVNEIYKQLRLKINKWINNNYYKLNHKYLTKEICKIYNLQACLKRYILRWHLKPESESRLDIYFTGQIVPEVQGCMPKCFSSKCWEDLATGNLKHNSMAGSERISSWWFSTDQFTDVISRCHAVNSFKTKEQNFEFNAVLNCKPVKLK